ncbi:urease accessory protein UreD [Actinoplanes sp. NPDC051411]|uniref:urease accessory protein UreD n=1 Tax=Actinoplanes sp. NPDC051411 TaxID=3155522 RepID=UPI003442BA78
MKARARLVAAPGDRLTVLRGEPPLLLRRTGPATVHLVGGAAGPLRGDDLRLEIEVEAGAELTVRGVAAQIALPGPGETPSRLEIRATVGPDATLRWLPEPLIAAAGCDHRTVTHAEVAEGGRLLWRDDLVFGRQGEPSGSLRSRALFRYAGSTVYRQDLAAGPDATGSAGPAVLGKAQALGTLLALPGVATWPPHGAGVASMPLAGPGVVITALGADIRGVRAALDPIGLEKG